MSMRIGAVHEPQIVPSPLMGVGLNGYDYRLRDGGLRQSMARSLKTNYLLLALGVSAVLALILGGLAYYEHRVNTSDANQLTYATVEEKLENDLQARARSLSNITSTSLAS